LIVADKEAILAIAWRRVITYLRQSPQNAKNVENMFKSKLLQKNKKNQNHYHGHKNHNIDDDDALLSTEELTSGLISIGIDLGNQVALIFHEDIDKNKDGYVSLTEFAISVEKYSQYISKEEVIGWETILTSLIPGSGGEFGGASEEAIKDPIKRIEVLFNAADLDQSGNLKISELTIAMKALGITMNDTQLALFYETLDTNNDGCISLDEFLKVFDDQNLIVKDVAWNGFLQLLALRFQNTHNAISDLFAIIDVNKDGLLDINELDRALQLIGIKLDPLHLKLVRKDIDINDDGFVSFDEFVEFIDNKIKTLSVNENDDDEHQNIDHQKNSNHHHHQNNEKEEVEEEVKVEEEEAWSESEAKQLMVAWKRVLLYLRKSPETAQSVERLFQNGSSATGQQPNKEKREEKVAGAGGDEGAKVLTQYELSNGLASLGITFEATTVLKTFQLDILKHYNGLISLVEFAECVEDYSLKIALEEKEGWEAVLMSYLHPSPNNNQDDSNNNNSDNNQQQQKSNMNHDEISEEILYDPIKRIEVLFKAADLDQSGDLNLDELAMAMKSLGITMNDGQLPLFYETLDTNNDGCISLDQFKKVFENRHNLAQDMSWAVIIFFILHFHDDIFILINQIYQKCDDDNDGYLNMNELNQCLEMFLGIKLNAIQLKLIFNDFNIHGIDLISVEDFMFTIDENIMSTDHSTPGQSSSNVNMNEIENEQNNEQNNEPVEEPVEVEVEVEEVILHPRSGLEEDDTLFTPKQSQNDDFEKMILDNNNDNNNLLHNNNDNLSDAILLVAWSKIITYLRQSIQNAKSVESLFQSKNKNDNSSQANNNNINNNNSGSHNSQTNNQSQILTIKELIKGFKNDLGIQLNYKEMKILILDFHKKTDRDFISLTEFADFVEDFSLKIKIDEKDAWDRVFENIIRENNTLHNDNLHSSKTQQNVDEDLLNDPIKRIEFLFNAADLDQSGNLKISELTIAMKALGITMNDTQLALFYETLDTNNDGCISLEEFKKVFDQQHSSARDIAWVAFVQFIEEMSGAGDVDYTLKEIFIKADIDNDGFLNLNELKLILNNDFGISLNELQLILIRNDMDINGDGMISYDEFKDTIIEKSQKVNLILSNSR